MKGRLFALVAVLQLLVSTAASFAAPQRTGHIKKELRDAAVVTDESVSPIRFVPQEVWYDVLLEDPRYGKYKGGYSTLKIEWDKNGDMVFSTAEKTSLTLYSVEMIKSEVNMKTYVDPESGRAKKIEYYAKGKSRGFWLIGKYLSPENSVTVEKTAYFDWKNLKITIVYGKGEGVHRRTIPLERNSVSPATSFAFMMKLKGTEGKIYKFRTFDVFTEKFYDGYLKYEGKREDGKHKFLTIPAGWGDEAQMAYWFGPPTEEAPNGKFEKIIINPIVSRYITLLPVSKKKALEPVTPLID